MEYLVDPQADRRQPGETPMRITSWRLEDGTPVIGFDAAKCYWATPLAVHKWELATARGRRILRAYARWELRHEADAQARMNRRQRRARRALLSH